LRSGRELPPELAVFRLVQHFRRAARAYQYRPYPGRIVLFVPEGRQGPGKQRQRLERQWRDIAAGGLEIHRIEGAVGHHRIVEEPYVQNLVAQLDNCLRQAQATSMQDAYDAPETRFRTAG
jgi:thioesterase domain-containing protein